MIPFYVSNRGYGYLWNLPSFGYVALNQDNTTWTSESAYQVSSALPVSQHLLATNAKMESFRASAIPCTILGYGQKKPSLSVAKTPKVPHHGGVFSLQTHPHPLPLNLMTQCIHIFGI